MGAADEKCVLAVHVGNGLTRLGVLRGQEVLGTRESSTPKRLTVDEALDQALAFLARVLGGECLPDGAILSCVVPSHTDVWAQALSQAVGTRALVVGPGLRTGVRMRQDDPTGVGPDRVANVAAARELLGAPAVVVSLGTTTNIEAVGSDGSFAGGIIAPGLGLGVRALAREAARLPLVELKAPTSVIGRGTREAMQSGVVLGEVARVDGLLDAVFAALGEDAPVVVTGPYAKLVAGLLRHENAVDELLTLRGLAHIWRINLR